MGAGAVGCCYGFELRAGHDVVLVGRAQHVKAIERQGLRLETKPSTKTFASRCRAPSRALLREIERAPKRCAAIKPHLAPDASQTRNADQMRGPAATGRVKPWYMLGPKWPDRACQDHGRGEPDIEQSTTSDVARVLIAPACRPTCAACVGKADPESRTRAIGDRTIAVRPARGDEMSCATSSMNAWLLRKRMA